MNSNLQIEKPQLSSLTERASLTEPGLQAVFSALPGNRVLLLPNDPEFTVIAASDTFVRNAKTRGELVIGLPLAHSLTQSPELADSLREVIATHLPASVILQQPSLFCRVLNTPVFSSPGQLHYILQSLKGPRKPATGQSIEMLESITDGFACFDSEWRFTYVNAAAEHFLGAPREHLLGKSHWELFPGTLGSIVETEYHRTMADRVSREFEYFFEPWQRWYSIKCFPTRDGGMSNYFRDITDKKRSESDWKRRQEELENANRRLEEFSYILSHDLREPLRTVKLLSEVFLTRLNSSDEPKAMECAYGMREGVTRMEDRIQGLLDYARAIQTDDSAPGSVDLADAFSQALQTMDQRLRDSGGEVTVESLPVVRGDAQQITHVFQNLLENSLKYSRPDAPPKLHISSQLNADSWTIAIEDNGIGFAPDQAERIFGLFSRLHTQKEYPGTGIGLAICQRIVERQGGRIWAVGKPGEGATFYLMLPKADE